MTAQEAIKDIRRQLAEIESEDADVTISTESLRMGIEALEKQIPKKPLFGTVHKDTTYHCSGCKNFIGFYDTRIYEYCHNCGQKLDWSEQNE